MKNKTLEQIAKDIRFDWEMNHRDEDEVRLYARSCGYCFDTAEQFIFDEYLENFSDKGKTNYQWYCLVDDVMLKKGYQIEDVDSLTELDYQMIWGYINQDIDRKIDKNIGIDAVGLAMIK